MFLRFNIAAVYNESRGGLELKDRFHNSYEFFLQTQ